MLPYIDETYPRKKKLSDLQIIRKSAPQISKPQFTKCSKCDRPFLNSQLESHLLECRGRLSFVLLKKSSLVTGEIFVASLLSQRYQRSISGVPVTIDSANGSNQLRKFPQINSSRNIVLEEAKHMSVPKNTTLKLSAIACDKRSNTGVRYPASHRTSHTKLKSNKDQRLHDSPPTKSSRGPSDLSPTTIRVSAETEAPRRPPNKPAARATLQLPTILSSNLEAKDSAHFSKTKLPLSTLSTVQETMNNTSKNKKPKEESKLDSATSVAFQLTSDLNTPSATSLTRRISFRGVGPPFVICYVCGRKFAPTAIAAHEPTCLQKWKQHNNDMPVHLQKPMPQKSDTRPVSAGHKGGRSAHGIEADEDSAWDTPQDNFPCDHCGRIFSLDRLLVHQRTCKVKEK